MSYCPIMSYRDQSRGVIPCLGDRCQFANDKGECLISTVLSKALDSQIKSEQEREAAHKHFETLLQTNSRGIIGVDLATPQPNIEFINNIPEDKDDWE